MKKREITDCNGDPYLTRWTLFGIGEWLEIYLHKFHRSDEDRALHDHPWAFMTLLLNSGYWEHSDKPGEEWKPSTSLAPKWMDVVGEKDNWQENCNPIRFEATRVAVKTWIPRFSILYRSAFWRHRIEIDKVPTYTLVIRFKRFREWGFWTETGFVNWKLWWRQNCE